MGQQLQLQPQEDFPFFLFFTMLIITAITTRASTRHIIMVETLSEIHASIFDRLLSLILFYLTSTFVVSFVASL